jgi:F-type H+-transporting ATPase subunit delta
VTETDLIAGYAEAAFAVARAEGALQRVTDELYAFAKGLEQQPDLRDALTDAALPVENRTQIVTDLLGDRAHAATVNLIGLIVAAGHARDLGKIVDRLAQASAAERQRVAAEVRSAVPLGEDQRARLAAALSRATGRDVEIQVVVDPSVVGGLVARVGELVFDGSIATRLDDAKQHLGANR